MNTIFQTGQGPSLPLNQNNIVIVAEAGEPEWSQEDGKTVVPLRVVNSVIENINVNESNSAGEMETDGDYLNTKNPLMSNDEDSSEWSDEFLKINKNRALSTAANDSDTKNTVDSMEDSKEMQDRDTKETIRTPILNSITNKITEVSTKLSDSARRELRLKQGKREAKPEQIFIRDLLRCRTCLGFVEPQENIPLYTLQPSGETLKTLLLYLLPQMGATVCDEDVVCKQCDSNIKFCVEFIDNCLKVETELLSELEENSPENEEESDEYEAKYNAEEAAQRPVTLDHDYLVGQAAAKIKSEAVESPMETEGTQSVDSFLNNDPTLAFAEEFLFECLRCGMTFEDEDALDEHAHLEHGILKESTEPMGEDDKIYYKCNVCDVLFASKQAYHIHVRNSHLGGGLYRQMTYTCKMCGNKFGHLGDLFEHKRKVHGYTCSICPERFNRKEDLDIHMQMHPDLYTCEICSKGFKARSSLSNHIRSHVEPNVHICEVCGRNFGSAEQLALHIEEDNHHEEKVLKQFTCEICDSSFNDRRKLNRHKKMYHECIKEYLCIACDKTFSSKTSLDSHYRLKHAEIKPYQCEHCGERFARLDYLRRHNNCTDPSHCRKFLKGPRRKFRYTKADGEPIKCKLCGKIFKDVYLLKLHLTTHTNIRRFRCSVCNLTFTTNKNRERHEKIHEDPLSRYRCIVCWKRAQSQEELDEHMMGHEKKYQCHVCHESFARIYLLNFHVSEEHADDEDVEKEKQIVFTEGLKEYLLEY
ncbi:hypothetical protein NQ315_013611 [Exocentrus adspersus]|uniref:C2H2-type domain-containing protein n=1 Tax=Exocentrus adspersus TaxID=1586481 RepID=A0AAV8W4Y9_9CUCU|nr:hypothetical protein NQ315_013611 [Exocentrus adspersus]